MTSWRESMGSHSGIRRRSTSTQLDGASVQSGGEEGRRGGRSGGDQAVTGAFAARRDAVVWKNTFLMIEGAGQLDKVTVTGTDAKIDVLKNGFNGPTAVTQTGKTAWVLEGKLNYMNDPKLGDPGVFKVFPVELK